jgi:allantoinase
VAIFDLLVQNGNVVGTDEIFEGNIYVRGDKIAAVTGKDVVWEAREVKDASGKLVFPGMIDVHAHLNDPGYTWREDFEHGTAAAAAGGVTTIIDMPLQNEPALTDASIFRAKHEAVKGKALVNYAFWGGLTGAPDRRQELHDAGVVAFKVFMGPVSPDYRSLDLGTIRDVLARAASLEALVGFHAEDFSIIKYEEARAREEGRAGRGDFLRSRPPAAEVIAVENVIALARETGARAHICHVSHPDAAERVRRAQAEGLPISAETCTHYLVYTEDDFLREGALFKCAPPLREKSAAQSLWSYVIDGTLGCVASDHSPCALREKEEKLRENEKNGENGIFGAWGGISGIQTTMQVFYHRAVCQRRLSPTLLSARLTQGPAKIFGLSGRKGAIEVGFDADFVIFDPEREWEITPDSLLYLNKISAFAGLKGKGRPVATFVGGEQVFSDRAGPEKNSFGHGRLEFRNGV